MFLTMKKRVALTAVAALALTSAAACGGDKETPATPGSTPELTLRLGFAGAVLSPGAAMYTSLPDVLGFWAEDHLKVEITRVEGTAVALSAMVGGQMDLAVVSGEAVIPAIADGQPFVIPYSLSQRGIVTVAARSDSAITGLAGLSGKNVGVPNLASGAVTFVKAGVAEAGGDPSTVKFVAIGTGAQAANAITSKQVDAVADTDTSVVSFQQAGANLKVLDSTVAGKLVIGVVAATTKDYLGKNKAAVEAWARGVAKATEWMQAHPEDAVKLHYKKFPDTKPSGDDATVIAAGVAQVKARLQNVTASGGGSGPYGSIRTDQLDYIIKYLTDNSVLKKPVTSAQVYDGSLIDAINKWDRTAIRNTAAPSS